MFEDPQPNDIVAGYCTPDCTVTEFNDMSETERNTHAGLVKGIDGKTCCVEEYNTWSNPQKAAFAGGTIINWPSMTVAILIGITIGTIIGEACILGIKYIFFFQ
jgi:hypothetical protein